MRFFKFNVLRDISECCLCACFEEFAGISEHSILKAHFLIFLRVNEGRTRHAPNVNNWDGKTVKEKILCVKSAAFICRHAACNAGGAFHLHFLPFVIIGGIKFIDIKVGKRNRFLEIKHCIVCGHRFNHIQIGKQFIKDNGPRHDGDFGIPDFLKINWALIPIISGIKYARNAESFCNKELLFLENVAVSITKHPSNIINKRLCDCNTLFLFGTKAQTIDKGQSCGFRVKNHVNFFSGHCTFSFQIRGYHRSPNYRYSLAQIRGKVNKGIGTRLDV